MADFFFWKLLLLSVVLTHRWWAQESPVQGLCWLPSCRRWLAAAAQLLWSIYYQWLVAELGTGQTCKTCRTWQVNGHLNRLVPVDVWGRFFRPIHQFHVETTIFHACLQKCERARRQLGKNAGTLHSKHCKTSLTCLAQGIMIAVCQPATRGQWGDVRRCDGNIISIKICSNNHQMSPNFILWWLLLIGWHRTTASSRHYALRLNDFLIFGSQKTIW